MSKFQVFIEESFVWCFREKLTRKAFNFDKRWIQKKTPEKDKKMLKLKFFCFVVLHAKIFMTKSIYWLIHFHARSSFGEGRVGSSPRRTRKTSRSTAISDSSAGSTPREDAQKPTTPPWCLTPPRSFVHTTRRGTFWHPEAFAKWRRLLFFRSNYEACVTCMLIWTGMR